LLEPAPFCRPPQIIGFSLNPSPPTASYTLVGKFGGLSQVDAIDARLMTSQVLVLTPLQMSTLEKPLKKIIICKVSLG
jgi:hypothetical protein